MTTYQAGDRIKYRTFTGRVRRAEVAAYLSNSVTKQWALDVKHVRRDGTVTTEVYRVAPCDIVR